VLGIVEAKEHSDEGYGSDPHDDDDDDDDDDDKDKKKRAKESKQRKYKKTDNDDDDDDDDKKKRAKESEHSSNRKYKKNDDDDDDDDDYKVSILFIYFAGKSQVFFKKVTDFWSVYCNSVFIKKNKIVPVPYLLPIVHSFPDPKYFFRIRIPIFLEFKFEFGLENQYFDAKIFPRVRLVVFI
jgi:hypothetical protein